MSLDIVHFPENPPDRDYCFVWTKPNGQKQRFNCGTKEGCEKLLAYYAVRAREAEKNGWDNL